MHIMIDVETMSTKPNASIVSIGAVKFNSNKVYDKDGFYCVVDLDSCIKHSMHVGGSTVYWWLGQKKETRRALTLDMIPITEAIGQLNEWLRTDAVTSVWGNGANFDNVIIRNAFEVTKIPIPWKYWQDRCFKTVKAIYPRLNLQREGVYHNALDDAIHQANYLLGLYKQYGFNL